VIKPSQLKHTARARDPKGSHTPYRREDIEEAKDYVVKKMQGGACDGFKDEFPWSDCEVDEYEYGEEDVASWWAERGFSEIPKNRPARPDGLRHGHNALVALLSRVSLANPARDFKSFLNKDSDYPELVFGWEEEIPMLERPAQKVRSRVSGGRVKEMKTEAKRGSDRLAKFTAPTPMCQIWIPNEFKAPARGSRF